MDHTLHELGQIVLNGLPTFFLIIFLQFYLKRVFFRPLEKTLQQRYEVTEGAQKNADEALRKADRRIAEYEEALDKARGEMYAEQEKVYKRIHDDQAVALEAARHKAEEFLLRAKADLAAEKQAAFESLASQSDALANQIADSILLKGKAA